MADNASLGWEEENIDTNGEVNDHNLLNYKPRELEEIPKEQTVKKAQDKVTASSSAKDNGDQIPDLGSSNARGPELL